MVHEVHAGQECHTQVHSRVPFQRGDCGIGTAGARARQYECYHTADMSNGAKDIHYNCLIF